jgi:hypothetical protein
MPGAREDVSSSNTVACRVDTEWGMTVVHRYVLYGARDYKLNGVSVRITPLTLATVTYLGRQHNSGQL